MKHHIRNTYIINYWVEIELLMRIRFRIYNYNILIRRIDRIMMVVNRNYLDSFDTNISISMIEIINRMISFLFLKRVLINLKIYSLLSFKV